jgi:hypothetical protein
MNLLFTISYQKGHQTSSMIIPSRRFLIALRAASADGGLLILP